MRRRSNAYGLYRVRRADEGFRVLRMLLTGDDNGNGETRNTLQRSQQLPLYIPNFYRGKAAGKTAGRSSGNWGTGTCAWYYRTVVTELLGVRGEPDGLRIDPQLPSSWKRAAVWRRFRGADFNISIQTSRRIDRLAVSLDGQPVLGNLVPLQRPNSRHRVDVLVPEKAGKV